MLELLLFRVGEATYAVRASEVVGLVRAVRLLPLPRAPALIAGLVDLRGELLPVLDLRRRFGLPPRPLRASDHFVVVQAGPRRLGLWVDRAEDFQHVPDETFDPAPASLPRVGFVAGVVKLAEGPVLLSDLAAFLSEAESAGLEAALAALGAQGGAR
jgi:purine-binding chemotaxis protein CheW